MEGCHGQRKSEYSARIREAGIAIRMTKYAI